MFRLEQPEIKRSKSFQIKTGWIIVKENDISTLCIHGKEKGNVLMSFSFTMIHLGQPENKISKFIQIKTHFGFQEGYQTALNNVH